MGKYQPNDNAAKSLQQKKIKDELRLHLLSKQDLFLLDWKMWGRSTRRFIFQAKGKKRVLFVGSNGNPFFSALSRQSHNFADIHKFYMIFWLFARVLYCSS